VVKYFYNVFTRLRGLSVGESVTASLELSRK